MARRSERCTMLALSCSAFQRDVQLEQSWQRVTELLSAAAEGDGDIEAATRQIELSLFLQAKWTFPK